MPRGVSMRSFSVKLGKVIVKSIHNSAKNSSLRKDEGDLSQPEEEKLSPGCVVILAVLIVIIVFSCLVIYITTN
ncbi:MAG: hypothetical protein CVU42_07595 [Chloroflexi bacterium HGW-Chloroflexi-4]|nr:MAG: hypothetical protein CVU42_07595 [Chloroflexi bacterium HGW-Chloroflexi-4]